MNEGCTEQQTARVLDTASMERDSFQDERQLQGEMQGWSVQGARAHAKYRFALAGWPRDSAGQECLCVCVSCFNRCDAYALHAVRVASNSQSEFQHRRSLVWTDPVSSGKIDKSRSAQPFKSFLGCGETLLTHRKLLLLALPGSGQGKHTYLTQTSLQVPP